MLKTFKYTKASGNVSIRQVYQMSIVDDDKLFCVDLTEFTAEEAEEYETILNTIHEQYIEAIKDAGLGSCFRTFLLERMG